MYSWCKHHSSGSEKSRGTESEALQFSFMQLSRHRRAQQRKAWQTMTGLHWSVGCWQLVTWVPSHPDHQKSRTDRVRMDLLLIDILNIKVANRCATHGHWKAKVSALHCLKLLKIFKWKCCILYALQIVLHAQLELFLRGARGFPGATQRRWILSRRHLKGWGLCMLYLVGCLRVLVIYKLLTIQMMTSAETHSLSG